MGVDITVITCHIMVRICITTFAKICLMLLASLFTIIFLHHQKYNKDKFEKHPRYYSNCLHYSN